MPRALLNGMLLCLTLGACAKSVQLAPPLPPPPSVVRAAKPTPVPDTPEAPKGGWTREQVDSLLLIDAKAIGQCNADKAALFAAGWPK